MQKTYTQSLSKTKSLMSLLTLAAILLNVWLLPSCNNKQQPSSEEIDKAFSKYVSAYTSGVISKASSIKIILVEEQKNIKVGDIVDSKLFSFDPEIKGKAFWSDKNTIVFQPDNYLNSNQKYKGSFKIDKIMTIDGKLKHFPLNFETVSQHIDLNIYGLKNADEDDPAPQILEGAILTADVADKNNIKKTLNASQESKKLTVNWLKNSEKNVYRFEVIGINRKESASEINLEWNGKEIGAKDSGSKDIEVPALGDFKVTDSKIIRGSDPYILVQFSDIIKPKQRFSDYVQTQGIKNPKFLVDGNQLRIYPKDKTGHQVKLKVFSGFKNVYNFGLKNNYEAILVFEQTKPSIKLTNSKGTILPSTDGLILPFEAVNLKAVDVEVVRIFQNNVLQFLQENDLGGQYQLKRVGRPVIKTQISLNNSGVTDFTVWNRFTLDLSKIIEAEPGAIYQVRINFRKEQSLYDCGENTENADLQDLETPKFVENPDWDPYENSYAPDYEWRERNNPCSNSYYGRKNMIQKNIFASNIGVIAKKGDDKSLKLAITDLRTTKPISSAKIDLFDFQNQMINSGNSDHDGFATIDLDLNPFLVVVSAGSEKAYLKVNDGNAISMSNFDVSGQKIMKGIKGFIYGERGVWRPGDSLHIAFMLEDSKSIIPDDHPVSMTLINPKGQVDQKLVRNSSTGGIYNFSTKVDKEAPTGNWLAKVNVGGAQFTKRIKIETVKPNRLKIDLDFDHETFKISDGNEKGKISVHWLHGAVARNAKVDMDMALSPAKTTFKGYSQYNFDDPAKYFEGNDVKIFDGKVNENGTANIDFELPKESTAPGMLKATIKGKAFEPGGDFSIFSRKFSYYPYSSFVGINLPKGQIKDNLLTTGENHEVSIAVVNDNGVKSNSKVKVELYKLRWRWWWDQSSNNVANYLSNDHRTPVQTKSINTKNGKANWKLNVHDDDWGRYYIRVTDLNSGHSTGKVVFLDWPDWAGRMQSGGGDAASMLVFTSDKKEYNVGENIKLNFPSTAGGRALISVENGTKVIDAFWKETSSGRTNVEIPATAEMAPNVYITITLIQPHANTKNDRPIRMYGTIPVKVSDPHTHLAPVITMPDVLYPNENVSITIQEKNDKAMAFTVAVVDEGLLDLTNFKTPKPWNTFYAREALGVKTWDVYDDVIGAYSGKIERILAIGGDDEIRGNNDKDANRFKPVVKYFGPYKIGEGDSKTINFTMPQYVGSVRTMVIASNEKDKAYGESENTTPVRQSLMVLGTLPRVLGPKEEFKLPVTVFAMDESVKSANINLEVGERLIITGQKTQTVNFTKPGEKVIYFDVKVKESLGASYVKVSGSAAGKKSEWDSEIQIRPANPIVTKIVNKQIEAKGSWQQDVKPFGIDGSNKITIEASVLPPINLEKRLEYLIKYPHGCIEQTTSSVFPQLYLDEIMDLSINQKVRIETNIKQAINRLRSFTTDDGGFAYWPGQSSPSNWGTNYAGHFLIEASKKGYHVPNDMMDKWKNFQKNRANKWQRNSNNGYRDNSLTQAYRLYTLALSGNADLGAMNRLKEVKELSNDAKWRLALAYAINGNKSIANSIISNLNTNTDENDYRYTYGSRLRDQAMILQTLNALNKKEETLDLFNKIAKQLGDPDQWMSTQTTAFCLMAVAEISSGDLFSQELNFTYQPSNGKKETVISQASTKQIDWPEASGSFTLTNGSEGIMFGNLTISGIPTEGEATDEEHLLKMEVIYKDNEGQILNVENIKQGMDFIAHITILNPGTNGNYKDMALTQIFPSGWEILNTRINDTQSNNQQSQFDYQDIRDDRVYTYFDLKSNERKSFSIMLNASYQGKFYLPAVSCEAMYNHDIRAVKAGKWINVLPE
ncbi:alpha-2-macroglobulin family protein [Aureibacter tunicatorum]|uniref:Alpha-2-macroglobulin domain-containing protein n=1 Tax=Aureibacter tunicatorum TaxID=866807 RepID=A0AAE3XUK0_9BACT|nr:MG2 domain-containing protein [Aureibacter tunicatorum]MDR6241984.1 hypothetical protein [Aureibacter tunicatorum]BDD07283.1 membrane protein [Aureibacter tunicatorum]